MDFIAFTILFIILVILFIALAILFVSCKSSVVIYYVLAAFFTAWLVFWPSIAMFCYVIVFCWTLITVNYTISTVILRLFWTVIRAYLTALIFGVFWNLVIRTLMAAIIVLINGVGTGWFSAKSIQASAFLR